VARKRRIDERGQLALNANSSHRHQSARRCIVTGFFPRSAGALLVLFLAGLSCGGSRHLESVTVQPSVATAENGQFQFTATGTFSEPPSPASLTSKDVTWCGGEVTSAPSASPNSCVGSLIPFATLDRNGLATCNPTFHGSGYILAGAHPIASKIPDEGSQFKVSGYATLTCP